MSSPSAAEWSQLLLAPVGQVCSGLLLYGIYMVLFIVAIVTLSRRKANGRKVLFAVTLTTGVLSTISIALLCANSVLWTRIIAETNQGPRPTLPHLKLSEAWNTVAITANIVLTLNILVTDIFFLYRCYVIWQWRRTPVILPASLIVATLASACFSDIKRDQMSRTLVYSVACATNVVLVILTAGRILWIQREAFHVGIANAVQRRYNNAINAILESGAIYCICAISLVIIAQCLPGNYWFYVMLGAYTQVVNIAPTLTIVRVGRGHTIETVSLEMGVSSEVLDIR
ncbi:hypothetical protein MSAN_01704200 [Mycena sanguinolenta]|uniref:Uncharacterized protein n=1 Tax=Mycena sanguinolenta TaxID=230812 RepID=A0A8H6XWY3_9AGAR|nr:hypothetical protein MSAN_01704200 [Mycena sanguinolenta]